MKNMDMVTMDFYSKWSISIVPVSVLGQIPIPMYIMARKGFTPEEGLAWTSGAHEPTDWGSPKEPEKTYTTLKPGSNSQEVLDARMKLYELGYFKKKPTQTEYTDSMADYVKKFEKDYGLTPDGVLSPEDQEVLFGL